jgi:hypothetical protein
MSSLPQAGQLDSQPFTLRSYRSRKAPNLVLVRDSAGQFTVSFDAVLPMWTSLQRETAVHWL